MEPTGNLKKQVEDQQLGWMTSHTLPVSSGKRPDRLRQSFANPCKDNPNSRHYRSKRIHCFYGPLRPK